MGLDCRWMCNTSAIPVHCDSDVRKGSRSREDRRICGTHPRSLSVPRGFGAARWWVLRGLRENAELCDMNTSIHHHRRCQVLLLLRSRIGRVLAECAVNCMIGVRSKDSRKLSKKNYPDGYAACECHRMAVNTLLSWAYRIIFLCRTAS